MHSCSCWVHAACRFGCSKSDTKRFLSLWVLSSSIFAVGNFEPIPIWDSHTIHPWTWLVRGLNTRDSRRFSLEWSCEKPQDLECQFSMRLRGVAANSFLTWDDLSAQPSIWLSRAATPEDRCLWCMERTASAKEKCTHSPFISSCKSGIVLMQY